MNSTEYARLYRQTRNNTFPRLSRETMKEVNKAYREASRRVSAIILQAEKAGKKSLTTASLNALNDQLMRSGNLVAAAVEKEIPLLIHDAYSRYGRIEKKYITDAVTKAGAGNLITSAGVDNMIVVVNDSLIVALSNRVYADGYTYSDRIWGAFDDKLLPMGINGDYQYRIKNVVNAGLAEGRDLTRIAEDIGVYTRDGKTKLANRYGKLQRGTPGFLKRISNKVDWRALRLVRSELYTSIQQAAVQNGRINAAATGEYDWKLTPGVIHDICICPELAQGSPYAEKDVPSYPHSNCFCTVVMILRNTNEFVKDLRAWSTGEKDVPYLRDWYNSSYLPVNR